MLFRCPSNSSSKCWLLSKYLFSHGILSALGFWNIEFDELDFLSISKSNFAGYTGSKNLIQTRQKFQFIKLDFLNSIFQNPSADRYCVRPINLDNTQRCQFDR